jgi:outer membrane protein TolC
MIQLAEEFDEKDTIANRWGCSPRCPPRSKLSVPGNVVATPASAGLATPAADLPLTLEHAWQLAEQANPTLNSAKANLATAEGQLADTQGLLWNNPQIAAERVRRTVPDPGLGDRRSASGVWA